MNIILKDGRKELYQWDTGRQIQFDDSAVGQAHFASKLFGRSMDVDIVDGVCTIPDELLQTGRPLHVYAWVGTALDWYTKTEKVVPVIPRNKPSDYVFTPTDQKTLEGLQNQIGDLSDLKTKDKDNLSVVAPSLKDSAGRYHRFLTNHSEVIADHKTQEFKTLPKVEVGDRAYILTKDEIIALTCTWAIDGHNTGDYITDADYHSVIDDAEYICYTGLKGWRNVRVVGFDSVPGGFAGLFDDD